MHVLEEGSGCFSRVSASGLGILPSVTSMSHILKVQANLFINIMMYYLLLYLSWAYSATGNMLSPRKRGYTM